jgi:hypothetical protein
MVSGGDSALSGRRVEMELGDHAEHREVDPC